MEKENKKKGYHIDEFMKDWAIEFKTNEEELAFRSAELLIRNLTSTIQMLKDYCDATTNGLSSRSLAKFIFGEIFKDLYSDIYLDSCKEGFIERINNVNKGIKIQGEESGYNRLNEVLSKLTNIDKYIDEPLYNDETLTPDQEERIMNTSGELRKIIERDIKNHLRDVDATVADGVQTYSERVINITIHNLIYNRKKLVNSIGTIVNIPEFG